MGHRTRTAAGFTLIELLLALSIAALLLSLATPLLQKAFPSLKLRAAARDLIQEIRYLQSAAVVNGVKAGIQFDLERGEYRSELVNGGTRRSLPMGLILTPAPAADGLSRLDAPREASFQFYPDGSSSGGSILLGNDTRQLEIRVDWLTGKVELREPQKP